MRSAFNVECIGHLWKREKRERAYNIEKKEREKCVLLRKRERE
jgi:hypothetical protein